MQQTTMQCGCRVLSVSIGKDGSISTRMVLCATHAGEHRKSCVPVSCGYTSGRAR